MNITKVLAKRWVKPEYSEAWVEEELLEVDGPKGGRVVINVKTGRIGFEEKGEIVAK